MNIPINGQIKELISLVRLPTPYNLLPTRMTSLICIIFHHHSSLLFYASQCLPRECMSSPVSVHKLIHRMNYFNDLHLITNLNLHACWTNNIINSGQKAVKNYTKRKLSVNISLEVKTHKLKDRSIVVIIFGGEKVIESHNLAYGRMMSIFEDERQPKRPHSFRSNKTQNKILS